jgi:BioD-like phosphotransacetylase family protein
MKRIYVAATQQHAGKTTTSLGLFKAAVDRGLTACFIKPVGQRYVMEDDERVDEDAILFKRVFSADGKLRELSPITIPRGFTQDYIFHRNPEAIYGPILEAIDHLAAGHDVAIIEGTGHAGVGSVLDASNAKVAEILQAHVVVVTGGGIGRCIDEICLNQALFDRHGVPVIGAIINKVWEEKFDRIAAAVRQGLTNNGVECLGVVPYRRELTYPTMRQLHEEMKLDVLCGEEYLDREVKDIIVAAMTPQNMINYIADGSLVVVPGDRVDNIIASINAQLMTERGSAPRIAGLMLTGGFVPHVSIVTMLGAVDVPVLVSDEDTAAAAFDAGSFVPKITARDAEKVELAESLIAEHVDTERIFRAVGAV